MVNAQKRANGLPDGEDLYRMLVDYILSRDDLDGGVALFDRDLRYVLLEGQRFVGLSLSKATSEGKTIWEVFPPEQCARVESMYRSTLAGEITEYELAFSDQTYLIRTEPIYNDRQEIIAGIYYEQDITSFKKAEPDLLKQCSDLQTLLFTERKQAEDKLQLISERFRLALTAIKGNFYDWNLETNHIERDERFADLLGYRFDEAEPTPQWWIDRIHPEDLDWASSLVFEALAHQDNFALEYRIRHREGHYVYISDHAVIKRNAQGQAIRVVGNTIDISDRKQLEIALRESEERFRSIFENVSAGIALVDPEGYVIAANEADCQFLGYPPSELIGMHFSKFTHPDDLQLDLDLYQSMLAGERNSYIIDKRYLRKDGAVIWGRLSVSLIRNQNQSVRYVAVVCEDITERKQAEEELQRQSERERLVSLIAQRIHQSLNLQEILDTAVKEIQAFLQSDRVIIYHFIPEQGGIVLAEAVEPGWISITGRIINDEYFAEHYTQLYRQGRIQVVSDIHTAGLTPCHVELLEQFQVQANLAVPIVQEERLWGLLVVHQCSHPRQWLPQEARLLKHLGTQMAIAIHQSELYQQVQKLNAELENQVQERTAQLQQVLEFESLLKRITDKVRDSLDENQILQTAVEELAIGLDVICCDTALYNLEQGTSTICHEHICTDIVPSIGQTFVIANLSEIYDQLLQGLCVQFTLLATPDEWTRGVEHYYAILSCPLMDDHGVLGDMWLFKPKQELFTAAEVRLVEQVANQCAIALRQSRLYQAAQAQVEELERLNQLKDDFLSTVSHELRTPMSNIKMASQMLEILLKQPLSVNDRQERMARYLQILQDECQRETQLINDLLELSRLDAQVEPLNLGTIALQVWLPHLVEPFEERIRTQQQQLHLGIPPDLPEFTTDLSYLERILTELLHNACKYTPSGETISVEVHPTSDQLIFTVANSGVEIPANELARVFDKFYRIPNNDPWRHGGTGLGLALVKKLAECLGGDIQAESAAGQTCFRIALPWELARLTHP
jgi:PAS domain S-box-containing protein